MQATFVNLEERQQEGNAERILIGMTDELELVAEPQVTAPLPQRTARAKRNAPVAAIRLTAQSLEDDAAHHSAELFYLQKQIQAQTQMVIVLEDGEHIEGCIEWYDRNALKVRGKTRSLVYKSAIKYMYKLGESGQ